MKTKIGFHISSAVGANSLWLQKIDSTIHLVLAVGVGGEIPRLLDVANRTSAHLVYRAWTYGDVGHSDHFPEYYARYGNDPRPLIKLHEPCFDAFSGIKHRVSYQLFNETGMDDHVWPHFVEFNTNFITEMESRGLSASVIGCGPGFPTGSREEIRQKWNIARPMFEAINDALGIHLINLHEYMGYPHIDWIPYLAGRYKWLLEDLEEMGLLTSKIRVYAGENGWADPAVLNPQYPSNPANGYRGFLMNGITPQQLGADAVLAAQTVYADPHFIGSCLFCLGDSGGWTEFDLLQEQGILDEIERLTGEEEPAEEPIVITEERKMFKVLRSPLLVRANPSRTGERVDLFEEGAIIETSGYTFNDGIMWRRLSDGRGYSAQYLLSDVDNPFLLEYIKPTDDTDDWVPSVLDNIRIIREQLDRIEVIVLSQGDN